MENVAIISISIRKPVFVYSKRFKTIIYKALVNKGIDKAKAVEIENKIYKGLLKKLGKYALIYGKFKIKVNLDKLEGELEANIKIKKIPVYKLSL